MGLYGVLLMVVWFLCFYCGVVNVMYLFDDGLIMVCWSGVECIGVDWGGVDWS